ncbi:hypothetical protein [Urbifossiella limnaea]|uniref:Uncharacterized protein n=1 Tax=Urbifossiella limnaea TaxID=2528023 RepID=A0A517Y215_9BACT|nr:hypothetical protein [Urbifossiella limnaea]QDU23802.1 hypothetical protein ETAA1_58100 [Urbifossiella limnaea]
MAIEFNCPHCATPYKLKDELAGKKATCKNPDCRQVITIPAPKATVPPTAAPSPARPKPPARKPPAPKPEDIEAAALAALADAPKEQQPADAPIPMTCAFCDHKWSESRDKAGKNVLCPNPECRERNKVPVPKDEKPKDWRAEDTGPSLRKELFEKPTDVVSSGGGGYVTRKSMEEAGALDHELEPVPLKRRLFYALLVLTPAVALVYGVVWLVGRTKDGREDRLVNDAITQFEKEGQAALPPGEGPLCGALLYTVAGQYALTETEGKEPEKALKDALAHFTKARGELGQAGQKDDAKKGGGAVRYAVGGELALAQLGLGGTDEEVIAGTRYRWVPQAASNRKLRVNEKTTDVHTELQKTLQLVLPADFDSRLALARRLTRELVKKGQVDVARDLPTVLFSTPEQAEAKAVVALEVWRADKASPFPAQAADELKAALAKGQPPAPFPASAVVLWKAVGTEKAPTLGVDGKLPAPTATLTDNARAVVVGLALLDGRGEDAAEAARRTGPLHARMRAAIQIGEWTGDPGAALDAVMSQVVVPAGKKPPDPAPPPALLLRLSQLAAAAGKADAAKQLADAIPDEGLKAWAKADALRLAAAPSSPLDESAFEAPVDAAKQRAGHAWGRFWVARHNARLSGDRSKEEKAVKGWPGGAVGPLGLAGIALGLRER